MSKISEDRIQQLDTYWHAANYLGAAQVYLRGNTLLKEPLKPEHIKPRLLGHWGTQPGLNIVYGHLDRLVQDTDASRCGDREVLFRRMTPPRSGRISRMALRNSS